MRINGHTCFHTQGFYLLNIAMKVWTDFNVNGQLIGPCFFKFFGKFLRLNDHQMYIANLAGCFANKFNDHGSEANVWNESSIHYIKMKPISLRFVDELTFFFQS